MEAGQTLDKLVAEKVMNWKHHNFNYSTSTAALNEPGVIRRDGTPLIRVTSLFHAWAEWYPSTDIDDAWDMVEMLTQRQNGKQPIAADFKLTRWLGGKWKCRFWGKHVPYRERMMVVAETAPLAICLAALKLVEINHAAEKDPQQ